MVRAELKEDLGQKGGASLRAFRVLVKSVVTGPATAGTELELLQSATSDGELPDCTALVFDIGAHYLFALNPSAQFPGSYRPIKDVDLGVVGWARELELGEYMSTGGATLTDVQLGTWQGGTL